MSGYYSPERLDIVVDNHFLTFPDNVQYNFVFDEHEGAQPQVTQHIIRDSDVYSPEFPNCYSPKLFKDFQRAMRAADQIMLGTVSADDNEWLKSFRFSPAEIPANYVDSPTMNFYQEINTYRGAGIAFRPIDTIADDPELHRQSVDNAYGAPYEYNPFWLISVVPARDSLMLRQLSAIGREQAKLREFTKIAVTCGVGHWPIAVAARYFGAKVTKTYTNEDIRSSKTDRYLLPYYRERFSGRRVLRPVDFLRIIYPHYSEYIHSEDFNSVLPLLALK